MIHVLVVFNISLQSHSHGVFLACSINPSLVYLSVCNHHIFARLRVIDSRTGHPLTLLHHPAAQRLLVRNLQNSKHKSMPSSRARRRPPVVPESAVSNNLINITTETALKS